MQISLLLDRFQVQLAARAQLDPLDDFSSWIEITHGTALTAAGAIHALAPSCSALGAAHVERSNVLMELLRVACTRRDLPVQSVIANCEAAFSQVCATLRACRDFGSL